VVHMLGEGPGAWNNAHHVRQMRRAVRDENPDGYVLGEHFGEATRWLQGEQEDGAMNYYGFAHPVRAWLAGHDLAGEPAELSAGRARGRRCRRASSSAGWPPRGRACRTTTSSPSST